MTLNQKERYLCNVLLHIVVGFIFTISLNANAAYALTQEVHQSGNIKLTIVSKPSKPKMNERTVYLITLTKNKKPLKLNGLHLLAGQKEENVQQENGGMDHDMGGGSTEGMDHGSQENSESKTHDSKDNDSAIDHGLGHGVMATGTATNIAGQYSAILNFRKTGVWKIKIGPIPNQNDLSGDFLFTVDEQVKADKSVLPLLNTVAILLVTAFIALRGKRNLNIKSKNGGLIEK